MFVILVSSFLVSEQIVHVSKVNKLNKKTSGDEKTKMLMFDIPKRERRRSL